MPRPVYPDDRLVACLYCSQVFLARPSHETVEPESSAAIRHEEVCALKPQAPVDYVPLTNGTATFPSHMHSIHYGIHQFQG